MTGPDNVWLYAVVPADQPAPSGVAGVADETVELIAGPGVAAVAGLVPRADFDAEPLQSHLDDPSWLERTALRHHQVIEALARQGPCLPMRLATLYRDEHRVADMLRERREEFLSALARITGRSERGVKIYLTRKAAETADDKQSAADERPGTAYLLRRKAQNDRRQEALWHAMDEARQIHTSLADVVAAATQHAPQSPEVSGRNEPMILNGAYLIDDSRTADFEAALASVAAQHPELRVEVTGPWPAYSFSGVDAEPEGD